MKIWHTHVPNRCESLLVHVSTATSPRQPSELVYYSWQLPSVIGLELAPERQSRAEQGTKQSSLPEVTHCGAGREQG